MTLRRQHLRNQDSLSGLSSTSGNGEGNGTSFQNPQQVFFALSAGTISELQAKEAWINQFGYSDNDAEDMLDEWRASQANDSDDSDESSEVPGNYIIPGNVGFATKANEPITDNAQFFYWDGNPDTHDWTTHGWGGERSGSAYDKVGPTLPLGPKVSFHPVGSYATRTSHYIAKFGENGEFYGFVPLRSKVGENIYAGQTIATVVQYFYHNLNQPGRHRAWRVQKNTTLREDSFFLLDKNVAEQGRQRWDHFNLDDFGLGKFMHADDAKNPGDIKLGKYNSRTRNRTSSNYRYNLMREYNSNSIFFSNKEHGPKEVHAVKVEWLAPRTIGFSKFTSPVTTNNKGKAAWIYRFPKQLDDKHDAAQIQKLTDMGFPNYGLSSTNKCYPLPTITERSFTAALKKRFSNWNSFATLDSHKLDTYESYSLLGRMEKNDFNPLSKSKDSSLNPDNKSEYVDKGGNKIYMSRKEINIVPMISSVKGTHDLEAPKTRYNPRGNVHKLLADERDTKYACYNTIDSGLVLSLMDPERYAYLSKMAINNTFFSERAFSKPGDRFIAIGQALIPYDSDVTSIDGKMQAFHSSERIILAKSNVSTYGIEKEALEEGTWRSNEVSARGVVNGEKISARLWDYLTPKVVMTTDDLINGNYIPGESILKDFVREFFGVELTPEWFNTLELVAYNATGNGTVTTNKTQKTHYDVNVAGNTLTYPYSIALFEIPPYYCGPSLDFNEAGEVLTPTLEKPGRIQIPIMGQPDSHLLYYTATNKWVRQRTHFYKKISEQDLDPQTAVEEGTLTEPPEDITVETIEGEVTANLHVNTRFVIPGSYSEDFVPGSNYVTGEDLTEAGIQIPSLGSVFTSNGVKVTDVTAKWGSIGSSNELINDLGPIPLNQELSMEQDLEIGALGALDWLPDAGTKTGKAVNNFIDEQKYGLDDLDVVLATSTAGAALTFAAISAAGLGLGFVLSGAGKGLGNFVGRALDPPLTK